MKILINEMRGCRKGPQDWFTGTVWIDEIVAAAAPGIRIPWGRRCMY
jgi:hypothetical protein